MCFSPSLQIKKKIQWNTKKYSNNSKQADKKNNGDEVQIG